MTESRVPAERVEKSRGIRVRELTQIMDTQRLGSDREIAYQNLQRLEQRLNRIQINPDAKIMALIHLAKTYHRFRDMNHNAERLIRITREIIDNNAEGLNKVRHLCHLFVAYSAYVSKNDNYNKSLVSHVIDSIYQIGNVHKQSAGLYLLSMSFARLRQTSYAQHVASEIPIYTTRMITLSALQRMNDIGPQKD